MIVAWLSFLEALLGVSLVAAGMVAAHFHYAPPFFGFQLFVFGFFLSILAFIFGVIGIFVTRNPMRAPARPRAVIGTILGLFVMVPVFAIVARTAKYPAINDITTDTDNPPEFVHAVELGPNHGRDMKYDKAQYAEKQARGYGQVQPLKMPETPDDAFKIVEKKARETAGWDITSADPATRTIEGFATSSLFHFQDDFVIQVRPGENNGSLLEMRSKSRDGKGDLGVNYRRIEDFFASVTPNSAG